MVPKHLARGGAPRQHEGAQRGSDFDRSKSDPNSFVNIKPRKSTQGIPPCSSALPLSASAFKLFCDVVRSPRCVVSVSKPAQGLLARTSVQSFRSLRERVGERGDHAADIDCGCGVQQYGRASSGRSLPCQHRFDDLRVCGGITTGKVILGGNLEAKG